MKARAILIGHTPCDNGYAVPHKDVLIIDSKDENGVYLHVKNDKVYNVPQLVKLLRPLYS